MKLIIFLCLTSLVFAQTVLNKNACNACNQMQSQSDCTTGRVNGCEWIASTSNSTNTTATTGGNCQVKAAVTYTSFCQLVTASTCAQTTGCAYVDSKCTHFTGCSAFTKTSTSECQAISYECVSDGTACIKASLCTEYKTSTVCESTPSISGILKCKWDTTTNACRDYVCSEADSTLTTDTQCDNWLSGCVTRGKGCWAKPLPLCNAYAGDATTCATYIGSDGNCELVTGATTCSAKLCQNAPTTTTTDADCKLYQKGCITNGKGCISGTLPQCSSYAGDNVSCVGYIGLDGVCEGDAGGTACRSRKCENAPTTYSTDIDCGKYKTGCKTTGKGCTTTLGLCSSYTGTSATCAGYIGTDGNCKGTSTTTSGPCTAKVCEDAPATATTDAACIAVQIGCKTTGQGCLKTLSSCTSYKGDAASCATRVGSEGNCTYASGTNCIARTCAGAATSINSTKACDSWLSGCVTNGAGCVSPTTCDNTQKELSCVGTTSCSWQPVCLSNAGCSSYSSSISICIANKARVVDYITPVYKKDGVTWDHDDTTYKFISCAWRNGSCVAMECSDLTGTYYATDANCNAALTGCISNKKDGCISKLDCSKFTGTRDTCKGQSGYCTNTAEATDTSVCLTRQCSDNVDAQDTPSCDSWLPGCITNGKGCVVSTTTCSQFQGLQATCDKLYGYYDSKKTVRCYNVSTALATDYCFNKACDQATGMTGESDCSTFLTGCVFNGKDSCTDPTTLLCSKYNSGPMNKFCDTVVIKDKTAGYCYGSAANTACKVRECTDNTTAIDQTACTSFMSGCVYKFGGGCFTVANVQCSDQQGTVATCKNFYAGLSSALVRCTKVDACAKRNCSDKANPTQESDCTTWKKSCRFLKAGVACIDSKLLCSDYNIPDNATTEQQKFTYCTNITNSSGLTCGYTKSETKCSSRNCEQFLSTYTTTLTCLNYYTQGTTTGTTVCSQAGQAACYTPIATCAYPIDLVTYNDDAKRTTYCQQFKSSSDRQCTFKSQDTTCSLQDTCEKVITQTSAKICNDVALASNCQKATTGCFSTSNDCTSYNLPSGSLTDDQKKAFCDSLKVIDQISYLGLGKGKFTNCAWRSGTKCSAKYASCADITSASSQADCNSQFAGCVYYNGTCIAKTANCNAALPANLTSSQKALFCLSQFDGTNYCKLKDDQSGCEANTDTDCTTPRTDPLAWDSAAVTDTKFCNYHPTKDRSKFCKAHTTAGQCVAGACEDIPGPASQGDCDKFIFGCVYSGSKCHTPGAGITIANDCADTNKVPFAGLTSDTAANKLAYCQVFHNSNMSLYCTYDSLNSTPPTACMDALPCTQYTTPNSDQLAFCRTKINTKGVQCTYESGTKCSETDYCIIVPQPESQVDCDQNSNGSECKYYKGFCYTSTLTTCDDISVQGTTADAKKTFCESIQTGGVRCRYVAGTFCSPTGSCDTYNVAAATDKLAACNSLTDGTNSCTFIARTNVNNCIQKDTCDNYTVDSGSETTQCPAVKSTAGYPCKKDNTNAGKCDPVVCEDITTGETDCGKNASNCLFYANKCYTKKTCDLYTVPDVSNKADWCNGVKNSAGDLCTWNSTNSNCKARSCTDVQYYTDNDCSTYLSTCKTDGTKCVVTTEVQCSQLGGDSNYCNYVSDETGAANCQPAATASTSSAACVPRSCFDNTYSQSDPECDEFMKGCVTRGKGCIPNNYSCDKYRGTKDQCERFKYFSYDTDNNQITNLCSGDATNTETSSCRARKCTDQTTAKEDTVCKNFLAGCVTNGAGCIANTELCTAYKGTNALCATFLGNYQVTQSDYCYGTASDATTVAACKKKQCTDISAKDNVDCYNGMKPFQDENGKDIYVFCVYDGDKSCVDNNKTCSYFKGTVDTCPQYKATDGPCKGTSNIVGSCVKRVCTEAPNTLTTDADCQDYHSTCYTTGQGCTSVRSCTQLSNKASCISRVECMWSNQCKSTVTNCSTFSNTSQSQCLNTKVDGKYCAWTESGSICRAQTCADQPASIKDHATCQAFSTTCTTSGAGCITLGVCTSYTLKSICLAASYTADGLGRCGWENNACRLRACIDKQATTDKECDDFLTGCKTNGTSCVAAKTCSDFNGNQKFCQQSQTGPCLYVGGICYDYTQCEDAPGKTHSICQTFSPLCTTNGTNCIPITSCASTTLKISCVVGTDGACGWLPAGGSNSTEKCQKFGACSDAVGATNEICQAYGPNCLTDGTNCVAPTTCSGYLTSTACNNNGTDGICFWTGTSGPCKLKECGDATSNNTTNDGCASFTVASGSCTTDGTKCIPLSTCSSYVEAGCVQGTDGTCTFALPVGATTGTKSCRLKACEDITGGTSNGACTGLSKKKCVSNGTSCISKAACTSYTTKSACNGGGLDSAGNEVVCAFTVTDTTKPNIGTCKQFSQCSDANNDSLACSTKSSACLWKASSTTTSCTAYACDTITSGTNCQPVPSFDGLSYTVCNLVNGKCAAADPGTIKDTNCYTKSAYTYSWNTATSKCVSCIAGSTTTNNTTNPNNTNTTTNDTTTTYGYLIGAMTLGLLGFMA